MRYVFIVLISLLPLSEAQEPRINGNFTFRGDFKDGHFLADGVLFEQIGEEVRISWDHGATKIAGSISDIRDFVKADNGMGCLLFVQTEGDARQFHLLYVRGQANKKSDAFSEYEFTENFDTIVELGGVSKTGIFFLAKGAELIPQNPVTGRRKVQHRWGVFRLENGSINEVKSKNGISEWRNYQNK